MSDTTNADNQLATYIETVRAAENARTQLLARLVAIKKERAEMHAKFTAEAKQIKALLGRGKTAKIAKAPRAPRQPKSTKANAA